jgi:glycine cleavage system regulatory protein
MSSNLVMTIIGPDRPGLVESLASTIAAHGGNWLESRMEHLGGQFAGILSVQVPEESVEPMTRALRELESNQLSVVVNRGASPEVSDSGRTALNLEVIGHDRPGIISKITRVLAGFKINVQELETERLSAPMSGEMMFQARARITLPKSCKEHDLQAELEFIASDLMVELRLEQE